jgi:hypothetical protein
VNKTQSKKEKRSRMNLILQQNQNRQFFLALLKCNHGFSQKALSLLHALPSVKLLEVTFSEF